LNFLNFGEVKTIKLLSISIYGFLQYKLLECRITSIEEKIDKLQELSFYFQSRFDNDRSEKINNKINYLYKRKMDLAAIVQ